MNNRKRSIIWKLTNEEFQNLLDTSNSKVDVLTKLKLSPYSGNHRTLARRIKEGQFDISKLNDNRKRCAKNHLSTFKFSKIHTKDNVFIKNASVERKIVKKIIINENIIPYSCNKCKNNGRWENENLSLQLEHKNGINNDNRIENLCFLCPNCHSQSTTFSGKKNKKVGAG